MSIVVYNTAGAKQTTAIKLPKHSVVGEVAVSRVVRATLANADRERALTKTRGEVRGGGKKPWRQKGTGRARVGSSRSPIWRSGGITFGPGGLPRRVRQIPSRVRKNARLTLLQQHADVGTLAVLTGTLNHAKTADGAKLAAKLALPKALVVVAPDELAVAKGFRNLADWNLVTTTQLNNAHLAGAPQLICSAAALEALTGAKATPVAKSAAKTPASTTSEKETA